MEESATVADDAQDDDGEKDPASWRRKYLRREQAKATVPAGGHKKYHQQVMGHKKMLVICVKGYRNCKIQDAKRTTATHRAAAIATGKEPLEKRRESPQLDERKQQLMEVLQKYGSAGAARKQARLEYHEFPSSAATGGAGLDTFLLDGPDMLRLG